LRGRDGNMDEPPAGARGGAHAPRAARSVCCFRGDLNKRKAYLSPQTIRKPVGISAAYQPEEIGLMLGELMLRGRRARGAATA